MDGPKASSTAGSQPIAIPWLEGVGLVAALDRNGAVGLSPARQRRERHRRLQWHKGGVPHPPSVTVAGSSLLARTTKSPPRAAQPKPVAQRTRPKPNPKVSALIQARRFSQAAFLVAFCFLLVQTGYRGAFEDNANVRLPYQVEAFLNADPFVAVVTLLSTGEVYGGLIWSLAVIVLTLLVGRAFCGWICPFGTLHHFAAWLFPSKLIRAKPRVVANGYRDWQLVKYYVLWGCLGAAVVGSAIGGLLDPICISVRALGLGVLPLLQYVAARATDALAVSNQPTLQRAGDVSSDALSQVLFPSDQPYFHETWAILSLLALVVFMNRVIPRFWCRVLCPLGALLGLFSRFSLLGMRKDHEKCTDCNLCLVHCQGADNPQGGVKHERAECHLCLNCVAACPEDVIHFEFLPSKTSIKQLPDHNRRTVVASAGFAAAGIAGFRLGDWPDRNYNPKVIRPPGAVEEREFLERCIRCAECMKVCPNNALHPALFEAGVEGVWTPILIPRVGYCEFSCVLCGQVCPTGAIQKITEPQKMGIGQKPVRVGTAMYDRGRCLPWAMATPCIVCEEFCPTSPKAIWTEEVHVPARPEGAASAGHGEGKTVLVKRPHVDPTLCVGCGACEKVCPVVDQPAVYVTSAGESRSRTNVILLENTAYD
jgi:polyferredoxin